jgi:hypothetical protein
MDDVFGAMPPTLPDTDDTQDSDAEAAVGDDLDDHPIYTRMVDRGQLDRCGVTLRG